MNNFSINKNNYDKFIFKGSLALESYYDATKENKELFDSFNKDLKAYRLLSKKNDSDKESIVTKLILTLEKIGEEKFIIYEDGTIEYNSMFDKGGKFHV